jgi:hypothetical protein
VPNDPIGWILAAIIVIPVLAAATVYFRGSKDTGTIKTLKENNEALNARVVLLEGDAARDGLARESLLGRLSLSERENTQLRAQRPSADAITQIGEDVDSLRVELHKHDVDTKRLLKKGDHDAD